MCLQLFSRTPEGFKLVQDWSISTPNQFALMKLTIRPEAGMVGSTWLDVDSGPIQYGQRSGSSEAVWERGGKSGLDLQRSQRELLDRAESS